MEAKDALVLARADALRREIQVQRERAQSGKRIQWHELESRIDVLISAMPPDARPEHKGTGFRLPQDAELLIGRGEAPK